VAVGGRGEPGPVVAHVQGGLAVHVGQGGGHPAGVGVPGHVGQGLLGDPEQGDLGVGAELGVPVTVAVATRPVSSATLPARRPRASPSGAARSWAGRRSQTSRRQLGLGRLELEDDADEALGQGVVDVAGQALALGQPATVALGGHQLAAGRLQLLDQPPALVALVDDPGEPGGRRR
jgi:hypothetical protein